MNDALLWDDDKPTEEHLAELLAEYELHGAVAIERLMDERPDVYVRIMALVIS